MSPWVILYQPLFTRRRSSARFSHTPLIRTLVLIFMMKGITFAAASAALLLHQVAALPHIDADTPIRLDTFKFNAKDGVDPHLGIDPETIRKYASLGPKVLHERVLGFDPEKQLVDG